MNCFAFMLNMADNYYMYYNLLSWFNVSGIFFGWGETVSA
jgi:hypothetical protein